MRVPNAEQAEVPDTKLRGYLLNVFHPNGRSKARLLLRLGYSLLRPEELSETSGSTCSTTSVRWNKRLGLRYIVRAPIVCPTGEERWFRSVW